MVSRGKRITGWVISASLLLGMIPPTASADEAMPANQPPSPISSTVLVQPTDDTGDTPPTEPVVDDSPVKGTSDVVVTALQTTAGLGFIELYNTNKTDPYSAQRLKINVQKSDGTALCVIQPTGYILPQTYALLGQQGIFPADAQIQSYQCGTSADVAGRVLVYEDGGTQPIEDIRLPNDDTQLWMRKGTTATYRTGVFATDFKPLDRTLYEGGWYTPPADMLLRITEVLVSPRDCLPGDAGLDCHDYVKITNPTDHDIDLAGYRLRSGFANTKATSMNTFSLSGVVKAGETQLIVRTAAGEPISLSANDGTVWFEDEFGVTGYDSNVPPYVGSSSTANEGRSWAYDAQDNTWKWAMPAPNTVANDFSVPAASLLPCPAGQYRSAETNRCRTLATATTYVPCQDGQYRSEITHRCRNIALAGGTLTPCKDNQYRSEATNRCRNIATATSSVLKPCGPGQERNPDTNRCRKVAVTNIPDAAFAVAPMKETGKAFIGWWALGGVGLIALGYAGWEWRRELMSAVHKVREFFTSGK